MFKKVLLILTLLFLFGVKPAQAFTSLSVRIAQPKSPTNTNTFDINFVTLDVLGRDITVKCFKKGPSDGSFNQFGSDIAITAGGNTSNCHVDSGLMNTSESTYQFYVEAYAGSDTAISATDTVDYKTSGPGTPSNYIKDHVSSCQYKISFKTADDGKTSKVEVYRSTNTSFNLDSGTRVGTVSIGPNSDGSFTDTVPDCGATYYYVIRAFDSAGNGSGTVGDSLTSTSTNPTPTSGSGAIPVSSVNLPTGPGVLGESINKTATSESEVLGVSTPAAEEVNLPGPSTPSSKLKWVIAGLVLLGLLAAAYVFYNRQKNRV